jgi:hypothetical protein
MRSFAYVAMRYRLWPRAREILKNHFEPSEEKHLRSRVAEVLIGILILVRVIYQFPHLFFMPR